MVKMTMTYSIIMYVSIDESFQSRGEDAREEHICYKRYYYYYNSHRARILPPTPAKVHRIHSITFVPFNIRQTSE